MGNSSRGDKNDNNDNNIYICKAHLRGCNSISVQLRLVLLLLAHMFIVDI